MRFRAQFYKCLAPSGSRNVRSLLDARSKQMVSLVEAEGSGATLHLCMRKRESGVLWRSNLACEIKCVLWWSFEALIGGSGLGPM